MELSGTGAAFMVPPPALYLGGTALGIALGRIWPKPLLPGVPKTIRRCLGMGLLVSGLGLAGMAVRTFQAAGVSPDPRRPVRALVTNGPYARTRNPIYLGFTLASAGIACLVNVRWCLLSLLGVLVVMDRVVIPREEAYLARQFGITYERYRTAVPRWL